MVSGRPEELMSTIQLPDELQRAIEQQVEQGRATSPAAFLQEAVLRLLEDTEAEQADIRRAAEAGIADMEAGRYVTVATPEDARLLDERLMARLRESLRTDT
jgi:Arc/MetJ-type ribon-helix-helix transcriptional regulator